MRRAALLVFTCSFIFAGGKPDIARDVELKKAIVGGLADVGAWALSKKLNAEARGMAEEALALDAADARAKDLSAKATGDSAASESDQKEWAKRKTDFGKKVASLYVDLSKQKHTAKDDAAFDGYFVKAYEWAPKEVGPMIDGEWRAALGKKDWDHAYRLCSGAEHVQSDPARAKSLKDIELHIGEKKALLRTASAHDNQYYLVLPKDWSPAKKWPILVYVEGAGCNFKGGIENWGEQRGDFNCILITPQTFSSTNKLADVKGRFTYDPAILEKYESGDRIGFDEEGLLNILDDVRKEFNGEDRIYITGFSGGGNLTWRWIFGHPEMINAACPCCGNFATAGKLSTDPAKETVPVKAFQGDKDEYRESLLEPEWIAAKKICDENGWKNVSRDMVPGAGHSTCMSQVLAFFKSQRK